MPHQPADSTATESTNRLWLNGDPGGPRLAAPTSRRDRAATTATHVRASYAILPVRYKLVASILLLQEFLASRNPFLARNDRMIRHWNLV
jgi:hypothetical protein